MDMQYTPGIRAGLVYRVVNDPAGANGRTLARQHVPFGIHVRKVARADL